MKQIKAKFLGDGLGPLLPLLIVGGAILLDWAVRLHWDGWQGNPDIPLFLYSGQRLVQTGELNWVAELHDNKLPVMQWLFALPALWGGFRAWHLMSMTAMLAGAYAVYRLLAGMFSGARGYPGRTGHYAGLYGAAFTLYSFSNGPESHHINALSVSLALVGAILTRAYVRDRGRGGGRPLALLLAGCFCASLAVGLRPYLAAFVGLVPLWLAFSAQLESKAGADWRAAARLFLAWNSLVALFLLLVNALPYVAIGEWKALLDCIAVIRMEFLTPPETLEPIRRLYFIFLGLDALATLLWLAYAGFLILFLPGLASGLHPRATAFDLAFLTLAAPLAIMSMFLAKHLLWHYFQFLTPFFGIGAAAFFVFVHRRKPSWLPALGAKKAITALLALALVSGPASHLETRLRPNSIDMLAQRLEALLADRGLAQETWLAPYDQDVHVSLQQPRHGFLNAILTRRAISGGMEGNPGWEALDFPARLRVPANMREYCRDLDERGPKLLVFFEYMRPALEAARARAAEAAPEAKAEPTAEATPEAAPEAAPEGEEEPLPESLLDCELRQYSFQDFPAEGKEFYDVGFLYIRRPPP